LFGRAKETAANEQAGAGVGINCVRAARSKSSLF
jgi:hypothetical protein